MRSNLNMHWLVPRGRNPMAGIATSALLVVFSCGAAFGQQPNDRPEGEPAQTLDEQLLDDLGGDLLEGLDDVPLDPAFDDAEETADPDDRKLLDQLEGEDIQPGGEDELTRIGRQMRLVERRIAEQEVSEKTQDLQQQIVADLEALIEQLKKRKQQSSPGSSSQAQKPKSSDVKQPDQPDAGQQKPSDKPASDSVERLGEQNPSLADTEAMQALVKRVWGHLPDRARQEMQNATVEEFLPKYQQVIEDYFRRLAEEEANRP